MRALSGNTYWVKIYMSGPIEVAKQVLRKECLEEGLCVTVDPTLFIYTGGEENGFVVGFINYPKFPVTEQSLIERAKRIAQKLMEETYQDSALVMDPYFTFWTTRRNE